MFVAGLAIWVSPAIALVQYASSPLTSNAPALRAIPSQTVGSGTDRAAGPCRAETKRYVNCGNGTITDATTGLIWLRKADCLPETNWKAANEAAAALKAGDCGLMDGSSPGDWRLPTKAEWEATIARAVALACTFEKAPSLTNDAGTACYGDGAGTSPVGVRSVGYWSSTLGVINPLLTIFPTTIVSSFVNLQHGDVVTIESMLNFGVWPVRSSAR